MRAIAAGAVDSYGGVATRAGLPGRARLVARVLATHEVADWPWHRVVRSDGRIAFPDGSASAAEQAARLRAEGLAVQGGRVRMPRRPTLDETLWAPPR